MGTNPIFSVGGQLLQHGFPDLSHMGIGLRHLKHSFVKLPHLYTDLYNRIKFPFGNRGMALDDPALCLVCGQVLNAANKQSENAESDKNSGECTLHSRQCGAGVGMFFLVQQYCVLLIRDSRASYHPSLYQDASGEVKQPKGQHRPMFLSEKRYD